MQKVQALLREKLGHDGSVRNADVARWAKAAEADDDVSFTTANLIVNRNIIYLCAARHNYYIEFWRTSGALTGPGTRGAQT